MLNPEEKENLEKFVNHVRSGNDITSAFLGGYLVGLVLKLDKENDAMRLIVFPDKQAESSTPLVFSGTPSAGDPNSPLAN